MDAKLNQIISQLGAVATKLDRHIIVSDEKLGLLEAGQNFIIHKLNSHDDEFADMRRASASHFAAVDRRFDRVLDMMQENFRLYLRLQKAGH